MTWSDIPHSCIHHQGRFQVSVKNLELEISHQSPPEADFHSCIWSDYGDSRLWPTISRTERQSMAPLNKVMERKLRTQRWGIYWPVHLFISWISPHRHDNQKLGSVYSFFTVSGHLTDPSSLHPTWLLDGSLLCMAHGRGYLPSTEHQGSRAFDPYIYFKAECLATLCSACFTYRQHCTASIINQCSCFGDLWNPPGTWKPPKSGP